MTERIDADVVTRAQEWLNRTAHPPVVAGDEPSRSERRTLVGDLAAAVIALTEERDSLRTQVAEAHAIICRGDHGNVKANLDCIVSAHISEGIDAADVDREHDSEIKRLTEERDAARTERDEWADAIRTVAPGYIASAHAAKHAIAALFEKFKKAQAERDAAIAERDAAITAVKRCSGLRKEAKDGAWLRQTAVHAGLGELEGAAAFHAITDQGEKLSAALAAARERIGVLEEALAAARKALTCDPVFDNHHICMRCQDDVDHDESVRKAIDAALKETP